MCVQPDTGRGQPEHELEMPVMAQRWTRKRRLAALVCVAASAGATVAGCGGASGLPPTSIAGPGSRTIVWGAGGPVEFPIYEEAGSLLSGQGLRLNYQLLDPRAAMSGFLAGRLAFDAGDGPAPSQVLSRQGATYAEVVPVAVWGVSVIYDLPSVHVRLNLDGKTLADIFRGSVASWNNREIKRDNPGVSLPAIPIRVVHRSDPATATAILTGYLSASSKRWRRKIGSGPTIHWPGGTADLGDQAVVQSITSTRGSIGYTEQPVALQNGLTAAALRTASKTYVAPTIATATNSTYPLLTSAYLLTYRDPCIAGLSAPETAAAQRVLTYLLGPGQAVVRRLWFAPLPRRVRAVARATVAHLQCESQPIG